MEIALTLLAIGALVWGMLCVRQLEPIWLGLAAVLVGYVFGYTFWHTSVGPLPVTIDRLLLGGCVATFVWRLRNRQLADSPWAPVDWALLVTLLWLTGSMLLAGKSPIVSDAPPHWRLVFSFWAPAMLYLAARQSQITERGITWLLAGFAGLGGYLTLTALAETAGVWGLVFPRYIANPELGLHFGRARGPALNSVSMGIYLAVGAGALWLLIPRLPQKLRVIAFAALPVMVFAILLTYTRSTWLGLAGGGVVVLAAQLPKAIRWKIVGGTLTAGAVLAAISWQAILQLEREDSGGVSQHSVQQREAFAYISWQMFQDYPLAGVGFGRFYDMKLPYLADRRQSFELESLRPLHHHNTFLSLLTETGLVGLAAYLGVLAGVLAAGWRLSQNEQATAAHRSLGVFALGTVMIYLPSALFHDLSLLYTDQWIVFLIAGAAVGCERRYAATAHRPYVAIPAAPAPVLPASPVPVLSEANRPAAIAAPHPSEFAMTKPSVVSLFGMKIANATLDQATDTVLDWCTDEFNGNCRFVVTPNVDHVVMHTHNKGLRAAYEDASLVVADGAPVVAASRLLGRPLPERVAGSDLVPSVLERGGSTDRPLRVFLLGAAPGVADTAAKRIEARYKNVEVVGTHCPPLGFEHDEQANNAAVQAVANVKPDVLVVGLGAPKQELWVHKNQHQLTAKAVLCAGATIDFLAGNKQRSPEWIQRLGAEWLHRLATEPRRLFARYARDAWFFPQLVWREWLATRTPNA